MPIAVWLSGNMLASINVDCTMPDTISAKMGDCLWRDKPSRYVTSHPSHSKLHLYILLVNFPLHLCLYLVLFLRYSTSNSNDVLEIFSSYLALNDINMTLKSTLGVTANGTNQSRVSSYLHSTITIAPSCTVFETNRDIDHADTCNKLRSTWLTYYVRRGRLSPLTGSVGQDWIMFCCWVVNYECVVPFNERLTL